MAVQRMVDLAGNILSPDQAKVSSEVAGVVRETLVEIGSEVRAGQPLIKIEPRELDLAVQRAESQLRQTYAQLGMHDAKGTEAPPPDEDVATVRTAAATLDDAKAAMARADALAKRGILSPVDLQSAQTKLRVAEAGYQSAFDTVHNLKAQLADRRAALELAQKKLADASVKAPISGAVVDRFVQAGEYISERTNVATIVQVNPLKIRTGVQERFANRIRPGQEVQFRVASFGDELFKGKVAFVSPAVDQTMRTFQVEALFDNTNRRLKPGFFAKGVILTHVDPAVLAVPDTAVSTLAGVSSVYVIKGGKVTQTNVTLGVRQGDLWEIVEGLKGDEVLANNRLNELATGINVRAGGDEGAAGGRGNRGGRRGQGAQGAPGGEGGQPGGERRGPGAPQGGPQAGSPPAGGQGEAPQGAAPSGERRGQGQMRQGGQAPGGTPGAPGEPGARRGGRRGDGSQRGGDTSQRGGVQ
jgi:membrane fusion protein, multidrug efflux system